MFSPYVFTGDFRDLWILDFGFWDFWMSVDLWMFVDVCTLINHSNSSLLLYPRTMNHIPYIYTVYDKHTPLHSQYDKIVED